MASLWQVYLGTFSTEPKKSRHSKPRTLEGREWIELVPCAGLGWRQEARSLQERSCPPSCLHQHLGDRTFHELQVKYLKQLLSSILDNCDCIHLVVDQWCLPSWKSEGEEWEENRNMPQQDEEYKLYSIVAISEWKSFVHNPVNRANLLNYMAEAWIAQKKALPVERTLILGEIFLDPGRTISVGHTVSRLSG